MDSQYQKWVNISFVAVAALVAFILFSFGLKVSATFDLETKVRSIENFLRIGSILVGAAVFFLMYSNPKVNTFTHEVMGELARVTWPSNKETYSATFVVIVMVLIAGVILAILDFLWVKLIQGIV
jgi:preprotein translocase subunit SecE